MLLDKPALRYIQPAKPRLVEVPPAGPGWLHEVKFDGYRTQLHLEAGRAKAFSSRGVDWSRKYPQIVAAAAELACTSAILDGEVYLPDERGAADFSGLPAAIRWKPEQLIFVPFDLLHHNGDDLRALPIEARRDMLQGLLATAPAACVAFSEEIGGDGPDAFAAVDRMGLEGIVSKRLGSRYRSGEVETWLKTKTFTEGEFEVIGTDITATGAPVALLARQDDRGLHYVGNAFITLKAADRDGFRHYVEQCSVSVPPIPLKARAIWLQPGLKARVRYLRGNGMLRHASLRGLRFERAVAS